MRIVQWVARYTGVTLLWTIVGLMLTALFVGGWMMVDGGGHVSAEPMPRPTQMAPLVPLVVHDHVEVLPALPIPPGELDMTVRARHRPAVPQRSLVQEQPSFYTACFGEPTQERSLCRRHFNRLIPEVDLMHRYRATTTGLPEQTRLVLGRIILSEGNWPHDERLDHANPADNHAEVDAPLIYQVLRHTRRRGETLLGAMRRHSPHVSEVRAIPSGHPRMVWVTELQLSCDRPAHFERTDRAGHPLNWDRDYRPRCEALFALAQRLLEGDGDVVGSWTNAPLVTWGGRCETPEGACDDHLASHRGLVPFETGDTANRFWCRPGVEGCPVPAVEPAAEEEPVAVEEGVGPDPVASEEVELSPAAT